MTLIPQITSTDGLELWGGHECTVNRVGDSWFDQTPRTGHEGRVEDLALFAGLGIRKLRYPALWERMSPERPDLCDFRWTDERIPEIRRLGMTPILTLCHHGSGPRYTSLLDDGFAPGLARHAAAVAQRYPWVGDYTPVNEPLTTARFSALYGYWYPHLTQEGAFWTALLNEIDATRLAMRAIRRVNPAARLVQTDDLGHCHATEPLRKQAEFENERRWLGWDLLCGTVVPGHALWDRLASFGLGDRLSVIADDPCPPDVIGANHYLSSERLLDHRLELHGDRGLADSEVGHCNGHAYVDVDAIRSIPDEVVGLSGLVEQTWQRYGRPVAVTECHHGCTREEQARWFIEAWRRMEELRERGVDVRAVTAWALLGSHDWNRMVTQVTGHYEPGVFDTRGGSPRPTLMASVLKDLARGQEPTGPALNVPGWWREERRTAARSFEVGPRPNELGAPPLMLVTDGGMLAALAVEACERRALPYLLVGRGTPAILRRVAPWAVLDVRGPAAVADSDLVRACRDQGIPLGRFCTSASSGACEVTLLIETSRVFTAEDDDSQAARLFDALDAGVPVDVDCGRPHAEVYGPTLIDGVLDLLLDGASGRVRFVPDDTISEGDLARVLAVLAGRDRDMVVTGRQPLPVPLNQGAASYLPPIDSVLERFACERRMVLRRRLEKAEVTDLELLQAAE